MKYILIVLLLFGSKMYCQTGLTKEEQTLLLKAATPERLQEWSDNKKRVTELLKVVKEKEKTIDSLSNQLQLQKDYFTSYLKRIAANNSKIESTTKEIDKLNESIISKLKWSKLHLLFNIEVPKITRFEQTTFSASLKYRLKIVEIGLNGGFQRISKNINDLPTYQFNTNLSMSFLIF